MTARHQEGDIPFSSNAERLAVREWLGLLLAFAAFCGLAGPAWKRLEVFDPSTDYRIPYDSSEDYWLYERLCDASPEADRVFVIGDSFVWGQYVGKDETLSSFLNRQAESEWFINAGLEGTHPLALEGLIKHHCAGMRNGEVILHLNLLWMSSPQADLQVGGGVGLNHPRLVPQFAPAIPGYQASVSEKIGVVAARFVPIFDWTRHVRSAYFSNSDLPTWTLNHPYLNPLRHVTLALPESEDGPRSDAEAWNAEGAALQAPPWVELGTSLQWGAFQRMVDVLRARGNAVFVLVGPLNEHMLQPSSAMAYRGILTQVESWLRSQDLPYYIPPLLSSGLYADLSHPLSEGYSRLARDLWERLPR